MKFKFMSVNHLIAETARVFRRFPVTALVVVFASAMLMIKFQLYAFSSPEGKALDHLVLAFALGIPISLAFHLMLESSAFKEKRTSPWLSLLALLPVAAAYFWLHTQNNSSEMIRYVHWSLFAHLLVAFAPFAGRLRHSNDRGFWSFNYRLFWGFIISRIFGVFLWLGAVFALLAITSLFEIKVASEWFEHWAVISLVLVASFHFLAMVPEPGTPNEEPPRTLKVFCQYVLVPLNIAYILILYAYIAKILVSGVWPQGVVSILISGVAILGVFALLMMHPFSEEPQNRWMKTFQKGYYLSVLPLLLMGVVAIGFRVEQYRFTEKRYVLIALSLWLMGIAIYNLVSRSKRILIIPVSLFMVALLTSFGPWGVYHVSLRSQQQRLTQILEKYNAIQNDALVATGKKLAEKDASELQEILIYILRSHRGDRLPAYIAKTESLPLKKAGDSEDPSVTVNAVQAFLKSKFKVEFLFRGVVETGERPFVFSIAKTQASVDADLTLMSIAYSKGEFNDLQHKTVYEFNTDITTGIATLTGNKKTLATWDLKSDLMALHKKEASGASPKEGEIVWSHEENGLKLILIPNRIEGKPADGKFSGLWIDGMLMIRTLAPR